MVLIIIIIIIHDHLQLHSQQKTLDRQKQDLESLHSQLQKLQEKEAQTQKENVLLKAELELVREKVREVCITEERAKLEISELKAKLAAVSQVCQLCILVS
jgi:septal ring factor EnvC (AmiA/AmiB activator)